MCIILLILYCTGYRSSLVREGWEGGQVREGRGERARGGRGERRGERGGVRREEG